VRRFIVPAFLGAAFATPALAQQGHSFTIHNDSPTSITEWRIAPAGSNQWGPNLLSSPIGPYKVVRRAFGQPGDSCIVDLQLRQASGVRTILRNQDACDPNFVQRAVGAEPPKAPATTGAPAAAPSGPPPEAPQDEPPS
jgi:hypothetical protein